MNEDVSATGDAIHTVVEIVSAYALDVVGAIVILLVGRWVAGLAERMAVRALARTGQTDATLTPFLGKAARYAVLIFVLVAVLSQFGVQTTSIVAALGAAGIAIGLALQGALGNVASGLMILFLRPFGVGDFIDGGGTGGTVTSIGLFATELKTFDGIYVSVPNSAFTGGAITNFSRLPTRRLDLTFSIDYGDDIEAGLGVLRGLIADDARVLADPEPQIMVLELGASSVDLGLRVWANTGDFWGLKWDLTRLGKERLESAGCTIPFPQQTVHMEQVKAG